MHFLKSLQRYPVIKNNPLLAYDAADVLLIERAENIQQQAHHRLPQLLVMNDTYGAVANGIKEFFADSINGSDFTIYSDSFISHHCISNQSVKKYYDLDQLGHDPIYDEVWMKFPKSMSFFEDQLRSISQVLKPDGWVVMGGMLKHLPHTVFNSLESIIGPTHTELAKKKARLVFAKKKRDPKNRIEPKWMAQDGIQLKIKQGAAVFSREKLDQGTRFFIEHLPQNEKGVLVDLGCGNGVVGIRAQQLSPLLKVIFTDDSYQAVQSAEWNNQQMRESMPEFKFQNPDYQWTHAASAVVDQSVDWVLCNPPFHQQNTVGTQIAEQMFLDAKRVLKSTGRLRIIGNSHLQYEGWLKKCFGNCREVARNTKFTILESVK
jgi:23S rRNA (guanine1835-N2)-methyltransferase